MCSGHILHSLLNTLRLHMQRKSSCNTKQLIIMQAPSLNPYQTAQQLETVMQWAYHLLCCENKDKKEKKKENVVYMRS